MTNKQSPPVEGGVTRELRLEVAMLLGDSHLYQWALGCTDNEYTNKEVALIWAQREYSKTNSTDPRSLVGLYQKALERL